MYIPTDELNTSRRVLPFVEGGVYYLTDPCFFNKFQFTESGKLATPLNLFIYTAFSNLKMFTHHPAYYTIPGRPITSSSSSSSSSSINKTNNIMGPDEEDRCWHIKSLNDIYHDNNNKRRENRQKKISNYYTKTVDCIGHNTCEYNMRRKGPALFSFSEEEEAMHRYQINKYILNLTLPETTEENNKLLFVGYVCDIPFETRIYEVWLHNNKTYFFDMMRLVAGKGYLNSINPLSQTAKNRYNEYSRFKCSEEHTFFDQGLPPSSYFLSLLLP